MSISTTTSAAHGSPTRTAAVIAVTARMSSPAWPRMSWRIMPTASQAAITSA
ncbi:hypothetical protein [Microbacterium sp. NIBRBAC000506063]|uniref:hypothetical protein n=1 Tax=Microbacterium sp. NIBRBAC000506063 TaxID=2734618 RepID=UPI001CB6C9E4|nr:hypothetical protein [Microbacterium sp. NIBRBAC000506063]